MESYQIIYGFADIKLQLIRKHALDKKPNDLRLWFSEVEDVLCVHDFLDHKISMIVALVESGTNKYRIEDKGYAIPLVEYAKELSQLNRKQLHEQLNDLFKSYGTWSSA